ncbi:MAG: flagellar hook-length control protein FliK [Rickettsiales bacterium]
MVNALVSLLLPNLNTGAQAGAAGTGLLTANPFDGLGATLNFSSFLDTTGKALDPAKLPELLNTLKEEGGFESLLQLPDAELPDFEKIDAIDQAIMVAAVILPTIPTAPQPEMPAEGTSLVESVGEAEAGTTELKTDASLPLPSILQQLFKQVSQAAEGVAPTGAETESEPDPAAAMLRDAIQNHMAAPFGIQKAEDKKANKVENTEELSDAVPKPSADTGSDDAEALATKTTAALTATVAPLLATDTDTTPTENAAATVAAVATPLVPDAPEADGEGAGDPIDEKKILLKTGVPADEETAKKKAEKKDDKLARADAAQPVIAQQQQTEDPKLAKMHTDASLKIAATDSDSSNGQQTSSGDKQQQNTNAANNVQQQANGLGQADANKQNDVDPTFMKMVRASNQGAHTPAPEQVLVNIKHAIHDQNDRIRIQLSPHDLGSVDITLTLKGDEVTQIRILAEKSETLDMLRHDRGFLERSLQESGLKADSGGLQFGLKGDQSANAQFSQGQSNGGRRYQPFQGDGAAGGEDEATPLAWQEVGGTDVLIASTGINIRV